MIRAVCVAVVLLAIAGAAVAMPSARESRPPRLALAAAPSGLLHSNSRDGQAILTARDLRPGESRSGEVTIRNEGGSGSMVLAVRPEGRLADRLRLRVTEAGSVVVDTGLGAAPDCVAAGALAAGQARTYRFTVAFERGEDDGAYMGAAATADFEWRDRCGADVPAEPPVSQPVLDAPATAGAGVNPAPPVRGALTLGDTRLAVGRGPYRFSGRAGTARVKVRCLEAASGTCAGRLELERRESGHGRGIAMAVGTFRIPTGKTRTVTLKLNARARRRIKSSRAVPVRAYVTATDAQGRRHRAAYRDTLRYSRR